METPQMENYLSGNLYDNTANYYDYDNRDIIKDDLEFYVEHANKTKGTILELASGTGRVSLYMAEQTKRQLECIELSEKMVDRFKIKLQTTHQHLQNKINIKIGDMSDFNFGQRFEFIMIPWRALQYLPEQELAIKCLDCVYRHLENNGVFVFDIFRPRKYDENWLGQESISYDVEADGKRIIRSTVNHYADTIKKKIQYKSRYKIIEGAKETIIEDLLTYKYYDHKEIVEIVQSLGFKIIAEYGYYDKREIKDGDEMIFVCSK
ncbi:MAG: class I SAM-dependent methyltransferase [Treponema sp.]|jgi:SAM-dependent methyltransferase|nr:class I SAM-dependent methyltransferase [Treponema sp.]